MIRQLCCFVLVCDGCGRECQHAEEFVAHYAIDVDAREGGEELGWSREGQRDLCRRCTCVRRGHDWAGPFYRPDGRIPPYRACERCDQIEAVPEPAGIPTALDPCPAGGTSYDDGPVRTDDASRGVTR